MTRQKDRFLQLILLCTGTAIVTSEESDYGSSDVQCDLADCSPEVQFNLEAASCNFSSSFCSYTQLTPTLDANNWTISNGRAVVRSGQTHFYATSVIRSPHLNSSVPACLVFLYTECMPSQLSVRLEDDEWGSCVVMDESGQQNDVLKQQKVNIPRIHGWIAFVARAGGNPRDGNITLKDVELRPGNCTGLTASENTCTTPSTQRTSPLTTDVTVTSNPTATTGSVSSTETTTIVSEGVRSTETTTIVSEGVRSTETTTIVSEGVRSTETTFAPEAVSSSSTAPSDDSLLQTTNLQESSTAEALRDVTASSSKESSEKTTAIIACVVIFIIMLIVAGILVCWRMKKRKVHPAKSDQASDQQETLPDNNNCVPPHDHFVVQRTDQRWADRLPSDDTPVPEQAEVTGDQPSNSSPTGPLTARDSDELGVHFDEDWGFDYGTSDDPYDFGYLSAAPTSGLLP